MSDEDLDAGELSLRDLCAFEDDDARFVDDVEGAGSSISAYVRLGVKDAKCPWLLSCKTGTVSRG
jgi:hypothetical protein